MPRSLHTSEVSFRTFGRLRHTNRLVCNTSLHPPNVPQPPKLWILSELLGRYQCAKRTRKIPSRYCHENWTRMVTGQYVTTLLSLLAEMWCNPNFPLVLMTTDSKLINNEISRRYQMGNLYQSLTSKTDNLEWNLSLICRTLSRWMMGSHKVQYLDLFCSLYS